MKKASLTQVRDHLSALVDQVRAGETILITERGRPVARLEPVVAMDDPSGRVARLERASAISVECVSALAPLEREKGIGADGLRMAMRRLEGLAQAWLEVDPAPVSDSWRSGSCVCIPFGRLTLSSSRRRP